MPLNVAMEEPDSRVVRLEADDSVAVGLDGICVALGWYAGEIPPLSSIFTSSACRSFNHLELVSMQMERVNSSVEIVDRDLDNLPFTHHKWVDCTIDQWIGVR